VYGDPLVHPQTESYWGNVNPSARAVSMTRRSVREAITMAYHRYHGVDTRIVRIFNTYGRACARGRTRRLELHRPGADDEPLTIYGDGRRRAASATSRRGGRDLQLFMNGDAIRRTSAIPTSTP
jgi:dTDP-glucose 4,6-dehydratase